MIKLFRLNEILFTDQHKGDIQRKYSPSLVTVSPLVFDNVDTPSLVSKLLANDPQSNTEFVEADNDRSSMKSRDDFKGILFCMIITVSF